MSIYLANDQLRNRSFFHILKKREKKFKNDKVGHRGKKILGTLGSCDCQIGLPG